MNLRPQSIMKPRKAYSGLSSIWPFGRAKSALLAGSAAKALAATLFLSEICRIVRVPQINACSVEAVTVAVSAMSRAYSSLPIFLLFFNWITKSPLLAFPLTIVRVLPNMAL